jgi:hypothetical protein
MEEWELSLPYAHLNLRANPFGHLSRPEKNAIFVPRIDLEPIIEGLKRPGFLVQLSHDGEFGKTSHLLAIRRHFPGAPYIFVPEEGPKPAIPEAAVLFIDRFHALNWRTRAGVLRRTASFAIVSHAHHRSEYVRAGLDYEVIALPPFSLDKLTEYIEARIAYFRRDPGRPVPTVDRELLGRLRSRLGGEHELSDYLYDLFEELESAVPIIAEERRTGGV